MKLLRRSKQLPSERRHVSQAGRTNAYAYYARRSTQPTPLGRQVFREALNARTAKKAAHYWRQRFGLVLILVAVVIGLYNVLSLSSNPKVLPVDASQPPLLRSTTTYQQAAQKLLETSIFNRNKITVDTATVEAGMKHEFPELSVVSITLPLIGQRPIMYLAQAQPALVLLTNSGRSYIVDSNGMAVEYSNQSLATENHLPLVKDSSNASVDVGRLALSSDAVAFMQAVLYQMNQKHIAVANFVLPAASSELDMYLAGKPYHVKFNLASDTALQQAGAFLAVKHSLEGRGIVPGSYIDVRLDGRAYYK